MENGHFVTAILLESSQCGRGSWIRMDLFQNLLASVWAEPLLRQSLSVLFPIVFYISASPALWDGLWLAAAGGVDGGVRPTPA